jgi:hypothetical protein
MASIPGGPADKLGNEYERLWAVQHLLELLSGRALSVTVEPLGDDERGAEFWVRRPDGTREAHQVKRENGSKGGWSAADLLAKGVIRNARFQLDRGPEHRFVFVSGDKAPLLDALQERAKRGDGAAVFYTHAIATDPKSKRLKTEFENLCRYLELDPSTPAGLEDAYSFLQRFHTRVEDKNALRWRVEDMASRWVTGNPADVTTALERFVTSNTTMGRELRDTHVIEALPSGSRPRDLRPTRSTLPAAELMLPLQSLRSPSWHASTAQSHPIIPASATGCWPRA